MTTAANLKDPHELAKTQLAFFSAQLLRKGVSLEDVVQLLEDEVERLEEPDARRAKKPCVGCGQIH